MNDKIKLIADHYGLGNQKEKAIEELFELGTALTHNDIPNIAEEIADVEIMLEQLKYLIKCDTAVETIKQSKINRQLGRIEEDE